ncbi:MAG TPA: hypothetical protein VEF34_16530, partial [Syntrophobacteraceae bacterium]|nr:hypothetical protein [Syntrophobacteraceae bacterium]
RAALEWVILLQLPLAIARELGVRSRTADAESRWRVIWTGLFTGTGILAAVCLLFLIFPQTSAALLFGSAKMSPWVTPFCSLLFAYGILLIANGIMRGLFSFNSANLIRLVCIAFLPTLCLIVGRKSDLRAVVSTMGCVSALTSFIFILHLFATRMPRGLLSRKTVRLDRGEMRGLLAFGMPRLLTLAMAAILSTMIPWLISNRNQPELLAAVNSLLAILAASSLLTAPIGFVLLPYFSRAISSGNRSQSAAQLTDILSFTYTVGILGTLFCLGAIPSIIAAWLGPSFSAYGGLIVGISLMLPGYLLLEVLRSPLDAVSRLPWNSLSYGAGAAAAGITFYASLRFCHLPLASASALALPLGYTLAGLCGALIAAKFYELPKPGRSFYRQSWSWLLCVLALSVEYTLNAHDYIKFLSCSALILIMVYIIYNTRPNWVQYFAKSLSDLKTKNLNKTGSDIDE